MQSLVQNPKHTLIACVVLFVIGFVVFGVGQDNLGAALSLLAIIGIVVSAVRIVIGSLVHAVKRKMVQSKENKHGSNHKNSIPPQIKVSPQIFAVKDENGNIMSHQIHDVETVLKVLAECVSLIETSKNLDVVESRRKFGLERAQILRGMESRGVYLSSPSSTDFISYFENEAFEYINRLKEPTHYDDMSGHEFEEYCAILLKNNGFVDVEVTSGSGDFGVDVLAAKDGVSYAIQCKRQSSNVGVKAVQEIFSGKEFYKRHIGVVFTNQHFTHSAKEKAERTGILLWDRDKLDELAAKAPNVSFNVQSSDYSNEQEKKHVMSPEKLKRANSAIRGMKENGIAGYVVSTSGDERVCDICIILDGKKYDIEEAVAGVNHPPFHEKCRCVALPYFDLPGVDVPWRKSS